MRPFTALAVALPLATAAFTTTALTIAGPAFAGEPRHPGAAVVHHQAKKDGGVSHIPVSRDEAAERVANAVGRQVRDVVTEKEVAAGIDPAAVANARVEAESVERQKLELKAIPIEKAVLNSQNPR